LKTNRSAALTVNISSQRACQAAQRRNSENSVKSLQISRSRFKRKKSSDGASLPRAYARGGFGVKPPHWAWYFTKNLLPSQGD